MKITIELNSIEEFNDLKNAMNSVGGQQLSGEPVKIEVHPISKTPAPAPVPQPLKAVPEQPAAPVKAEQPKANGQPDPVKALEIILLETQAKMAQGKGQLVKDLLIAKFGGRKVAQLTPDEFDTYREELKKL